MSVRQFLLSSNLNQSETFFFDLQGEVAGCGFGWLGVDDGGDAVASACILQVHDAMNIISVQFNWSVELLFDVMMMVVGGGLVVWWFIDKERKREKRVRQMNNNQL